MRRLWLKAAILILLLCLSFLIGWVAGAQFTVTPNLNLQLPVIGTANWGSFINGNFSTLDADLACFGSGSCNLGGAIVSTSTITTTNTVKAGSFVNTAGTAALIGLRGSVAGSTTLLAANTCGDVVTLTVTGATTAMDAHASGAVSSGLAPYAWVSSVNTVSVEYCNVTTGGITPAAATLQVTVIE